jgi:uncharacterized protein (DUF4415 family)
MRKEYNFSKAKKNPYPAKLKRQITIRLDADTIDYFKRIAASTEIPYQKLINLYLRDCALEERKPQIAWEVSAAKPAASETTSRRKLG